MWGWGPGNDSMTCAYRCRDYKYFGMQWWGQCFCGNEYGSHYQHTNSYGKKILTTIGDIRGLDGGLIMVAGEIKYIEHRALVDKNGNNAQTKVVYVILDKEVKIIL